MTCWRCGGLTESRLVRFCVSDQSPPLLVTNLPADVCRQCGERTYSTRTLTLLKQIRDGEAPNPQLGYLYIYDFDEIDHGNGKKNSGFEVSHDLIVTGTTEIDVAPIRHVVG